MTLAIAAGFLDGVVLEFCRDVGNLDVRRRMKLCRCYGGVYSDVDLIYMCFKIDV